MRPGTAAIWVALPRTCFSETSEALRGSRCRSWTADTSNRLSLYRGPRRPGVRRTPSVERVGVGPLWEPIRYRKAGLEPPARFYSATEWAARSRQGTRRGYGAGVLAGRAKEGMIRPNFWRILPESWFEFRDVL
jgi:hypothetical protein